MSTLLDIFAEAFAAERHKPALASYGIERLSVSSDDGFWKCPEQWRRERLMGEKRPSSGYLLFGSAFDRAAQGNFVQKQESHEDLPLKEMRDLTGDSWTAVLAEEIGTNEICWAEGESPGDVQNGVIAAMVGTDAAPGYHQVLAPTVQPVAVQRWVEAEIAGIPFVGKIDVETETDVIDLKTSGQRKNQGELDRDKQASAYLWFRDREGNAAAQFRWHVAVKNKTPTSQELVTTRTPFQLAMFERHIQVTWATIDHYLTTYGPDGPWPEAPANIRVCSVKMCSFWPSCPWRGGAK